MGQRILIDPVTRIEGHAKITVHLNDAGKVTEARFHVTEFRGFERMYEGRPMWEMPAITARVCGICPVSHLLASAKAGDQILAAQIPPPAEKLRRLINFAQIVQSHALSFFHLSAPDLLLGLESDPAKRNVFGLMAAEPELARGGIRLRKFGQEIIDALGGKKVHPSWSVPGGVRAPLTAEDRDRIRAALPEARQIILSALARFKQLLDRYEEEVATFGNFPTLFLGLVKPDGGWEHYHGVIRLVDAKRQIVGDQLDPTHYKDYIGESVEPWSYLKSPYYKPAGYPDGVYRVGPLARLNICTHMGTPLADAELKEFRGRGDVASTSSFYFHYARLIEILTCVEGIERAIDDPDVLSNDLRAHAGVNRREGIGVSEAPRGILFHHYQVDENGLIQKANLIIATGQNNLAMNRTVTQIAQRYIKGADVPEGTLNRLEAGIRAFDPCLSCSTHAAGQMPLQVQVVGPDGTMLNEVRRDG